MTSKENHVIDVGGGGSNKKQLILIKRERDIDEISQSPKHSTETITAPEATLHPTTNVNHSSIKQMKRSVKFLEDGLLLTDHIQEYLEENSDFLVVGVVGRQGVGKSTIMNLLVSSHNYCSTEAGHSSEAEVTLDEAKKSHWSREIKEVFKQQTVEDIECSGCATRGIDMFITKQKMILLDCQPMISVAICDEMLQNENKRTNNISDFIAADNYSEIYSLQLTAFLMSVCHVLIVVQDWCFDTNVIRFIRTAEILKPLRSTAEDIFNEHFPHLLLVHNKAQMADFSPKNTKRIEEVFALLLAKSKHQQCTGLNVTDDYTVAYRDATDGDFSVFLVPEFDPKKDLPFKWHPTVDELITKIKCKVFGTNVSALTQIKLTEKSWSNYCHKVWENIKKSPLFVEYTKLIP